MVKKPTGFLNKNRLNVALSRVRRKLYFVADMSKFEEASRNTNWECSEMAKDLLELAVNDDSVIVVKDGSDVVG
jgi:superfamily I DNA and/or RNA helicase